MEVDERWMPVMGYEGWYEVSDHGRVRNVKRRKSTQPGRVLKASLDSRGRPHVGLSRHGKRVVGRIHRLVYEAFVGAIPADKEINHIDGDPTNNHLDNLEAVTRSENIRHAFENGLNVPNPRKGERAPNAKLRRKDVEYILRNPDLSAQALADQFGVSDTAVYDIRRGVRWAHISTEGQIKATKEAQQSRMSKAQRGENHPNARLSADDVRKIRQQYGDGKSVRELSEEWDIYVEYARKIVKRTAWSHVK